MTGLVCGIEGCKEVSPYSHPRLCDKHRYERDVERWQRMAVVEWDGEGMLYSDAKDRYYNSMEQAVEDVEDDQEMDDLRLVICEPVYAREFSVSDWVCDDAHDDWEDDTDVEKKINELLRSLGVLSYEPGNTRPDTRMEQEALDHIRGPHEFDRRSAGAEYPALEALGPWCGTCGEKESDPRHARA